MRFVDLKQDIIRNIFLENHRQNAVEKLFPDTFRKGQKPQVLQSLFLLYAKLRTIGVY